MEIAIRPETVQEGDVDDFREITRIIIEEVDFGSLSDENLRRVYTMYEISRGVVNGRTTPVTQADVERLWCSSVDGVVAVARQVIGFVGEMDFQSLDDQRKQSIIAMLRGVCDIVSKADALDSSEWAVLGELKSKVGLSEPMMIAEVKTVDEVTNTELNNRIAQLEEQLKEHDDRIKRLEADRNKPAAPE